MDTVLVLLSTELHYFFLLRWLVVVTQCHADTGHQFPRLHAISFEKPVNLSVVENVGSAFSHPPIILTGLNNLKHSTQVSLCSWKKRWNPFSSTVSRFCLTKTLSSVKRRHRIPKSIHEFIMFTMPMLIQSDDILPWLLHWSLIAAFRVSTNRVISRLCGPNCATQLVVELLDD